MSIQLSGVNLGSPAGIGFGMGTKKWVDPLAGIPISIRLQTHKGDKVPLGIYAEAACITPVTAPGFFVGGWKAELGNGASYGEDDGGLQPTYNTSGSGTPIIVSNGSTSCLTSGVIAPVSMIALVRGTAGSSFGRVFGMGTGGSAIQRTFVPSDIWQASFLGVTFTIGAITGGFDLIEAQGFAGASYTAINGVETPIVDSIFNAGFAYTIFDFTPGGGQNLNGDIIALFINDAPYAPADLIKIRNYLATLR